jgi:uncharacterized protein YndB with AHSA1/START domain
MKWILVVLAVLLGLVALIALVGLFVPREHRASCRARFRAAPEALYAVLADFEGYPAWRGDVKAVRRLDAIGDRPAFVEETSQGPRTYTIEQAEPGRKLVLRIADENLPYGGTWTFALEADAAGTTLTITEDGFVKNVIFRALARFAFGYHATLERYLEALARKLGQQITVEHV